MHNGDAPILYLVGGFSIGGTERHLSQVLPRLKEGGLSIRVCALGEDGPFSEPLRAAGIPVDFIGAGKVVPIPKLRGLLALAGKVLKVAALIRRCRPAVVHCFLPEPCSIGWLATRLVGHRYSLLMSKRSQMGRPGAFAGDKALERRALCSADRVLGHSRAVVEELAANGVSRSRLELIHNGLDVAAPPDRTRAELRRAKGWSEDTTVFAVLANLIPYKGHTVLVQALARLDREMGGRAWAAVFIGDLSRCDYVAEVKRHIALAGLAGRIHFLGQTEDPETWLAASDVGVLVSQHEGFSNALLEYMAAGLPAIATAVGGNLDAVADGETGWLVPPDDIEALASALTRAADPMQRRRCGPAARLRYEREFTLAGCVAKYRQLYSSLPAPTW